ncbi:MAG: hypothetical protein ACXWC4_05125 [Telluria sp.]
MKKLALAAIAVVLLLSGCATPEASTEPTNRSVLLVPGTRPDLAFKVETMGTAAGTLYLNSIRDYRDARCITVAIKPSVVRQLQARYGENLETAFSGHRVYVHGAKVDLIAIEYQAPPLIVKPIAYRTQITIARAEQIDLI